MSVRDVLASKVRLGNLLAECGLGWNEIAYGNTLLILHPCVIGSIYADVHLVSMSIHLN